MTVVEVTNRSTRQGQLGSNMARTDTESIKVTSSKPSLAKVVTVSSLADMASERVFVRKVRKVGKLQKLDEHYCGPYRILRILGVVCWLENLATGRKVCVHTDRIKTCHNMSLDGAANINDGCIFTATEITSNSTEQEDLVKQHRIPEDTRKSMMALNDCVGFFKDNSSSVKQLAITVNSSVTTLAVPTKNPIKSNDDSKPEVKNMHFGLTCYFCKKRNHIALNCKLRIANDAGESRGDKTGSTPDAKDTSSTGAIKKGGEDDKSGPVKSFKGGGLCHIATSCLKDVNLKDTDF